MPVIKKIYGQKMKNAYWARFFKRRDGSYTVDVPDLPGCATKGDCLEEAFQRLVEEAIPLWLEDQPWPVGRKADEIMALPCESAVPLSVLVRVSIDEISGTPLKAWPIRSVDVEYDRRRHN